MVAGAYDKFDENYGEDVDSTLTGLAHSIGNVVYEPAREKISNIISDRYGDLGVP